MSDQKQFNCVNNFSSRLFNIDDRAAQGSTLSPLKFILYVKDLVIASNVYKFHLYAIATSATVTSTNLASAIDTVKEELQNVISDFAWGGRDCQEKFFYILIIYINIYIYIYKYKYTYIMCIYMYIYTY